MEEESNDDGGDEKLTEEEFIRKYLEEDDDDEVPDGAEVKRKIWKSLKEILKELDGQRMKVADIIRAIDEAKDTDELSSKLVALSIINSAAAKKNLDSGEWMYSEIDKIKKNAMKTEYAIIPGMLKQIMHGSMSYLTSQDLKQMEKEMALVAPIEVQDPVLKINADLRKRAAEMEKEGLDMKDLKRSKLGFLSLGLFVKSKMLDKKTRVWPCPVEGCLEAFKTSRSCNSHLNQHLSYEYGPCETCGYTHTHLDSYEKHKCFSNLEERCGRKKKATASAVAGSEEKKMKKD